MLLLLPKIIKISTCLSKLQLAKIGAFFEIQSICVIMNTIMITRSRECVVSGPNSSFSEVDFYFLNREAIIACALRTAS